MDDETDIDRLWKLRKYAIKMSKDRGYIVSDSELNQSLEEFKQQYGDKPSSGRPQRSDLDILVASTIDTSDQMYVFFSDVPKVGIKPFKTYIQQMERDGVSHGVIIVQDSVTPSAKQALTDVAPRYIMQTFTEAEILVNITEHKLVPKHAVLTPQEKQDLLIKYKVCDKQLPKMKVHDPVARYYGLKRGQVVKIVRTGETAGEYVTYRILD